MSRGHRALRNDNARLKRASAICHLCGEPIDRDLAWPHPKSWSADHLTPVAHGGDMLGERLPAHLECNQKRGTKPIDTHISRTRGTREW